MSVEVGQKYLRPDEEPEFRRPWYVVAVLSSRVMLQRGNLAQAVPHEHLSDGTFERVLEQRHGPVDG